MKAITDIVIFDSDLYVLATLKGYCYANHIALTEMDFTIDGISEVEKLNPALIVAPSTLFNASAKNIEINLLLQLAARNEIKICTVNKIRNYTVPAELSDSIDVVINEPIDISEIDKYLKTNFLLRRGGFFVEQRRNRERRSFTERRHIELKNFGREEHKPRALATESFKIDRGNKCVQIYGKQIDLSRKEFELIELLATDDTRIFTTEEILTRIWPENHRATKSDLYQYMHLLRKKIETDPNNPRWIMNIKGFGYKLNTSNSQPTMLVNLRSEIATDLNKSPAYFIKKRSADFLSTATP